MTLFSINLEIEVLVHFLHLLQVQSILCGVILSVFYSLVTRNLRIVAILIIYFVQAHFVDFMVRHVQDYERVWYYASLLKCQSLDSGLREPL